MTVPIDRAETSEPVAETLIVGGGIVGLAIGWRLARAGRGVAVLERDAAGAPPSCASWAAAGMLAPLAEAGFDEPALLALSRRSLEMYPAFVQELEADAGMRVDHRTEGTLVVAVDRDDAAWLARLYDFQREAGLPTQWLRGAEAIEREPHLAAGVTAAVLASSDHQVDNRLLWQALREAFVRAGGELRTGVTVRRVAHEHGRATGVWVAEGEDGDDERLVRAGQVVACAGAWLRPLLASTLAATALPPVRPVKGQMLSLASSSLLRLSCVIRTRRVYLAPKSDGRIVIGATSEEVGYDTRVTAGGLLELLRHAWEVVPAVYDLPVQETWAGLRPASRDHAPILGATRLDGLFIAAGHYRHGVLLTPATAHGMAELLLTGRLPDALAPFSPERFHPAARARSSGELHAV
jgi:glycine oxidase